MCKKALEYTYNNANGRDINKLAISFLKSKSIAVCTRGISKDERINMFYNIECKEI